VRWEAGLERRDLGVDALRGVALMSMFVAHVAPSDGPGGLLNLSEYLTYPLFAAIVGMGAWLGRDQPFGSALVRGGVLVALGLWLDGRGSFVIIVLAYLGLLTWVMHPLSRCRTAVVGAVGLLSLAAAPPLRHALLDQRPELYLHGHATSARLLDWVATGDEYRLTSMVGYACLGMVLLREVRGGRLSTRARQGVAVAVLFVGVVVFGAAGRTGVVELHPYEATWREHAFCALLLALVALSTVVVAGSLGVATRAFAAVGQMALSLYVLQILYLAAYVHDIHPGLTADDSWGNLALLVVGSFLLVLAWRTVVRRGVFRRGPLEGVTALLVRAHLGRRPVAVAA
jgi:hypothetical protein